MSGRPTISYVIGAHNEERVLPSTVQRIAERLEEGTGSEIIVVENGSIDRTAEIAAMLAARYTTGRVAVRAESSAKGFGNALRRGIDLARADIIALTAADLPFGFTDLDAVLALRPLPALAIGSKAHPASIVRIGWQRRLMSLAFRVVRTAMVGVDVGDTQGTIFVQRTLAQRLSPELCSGGYFLSTELIVLAAHRGIGIVEVPIDYSRPRGDSRVHTVRDAADMVHEMWRLRKRLRETPSYR